MTTWRKPRPRAERQINDSIARSYGRVLRAHLQSIGSSPAPGAQVHLSIRSMQDVADGTFQPSFLRGKKQAAGNMAALQPEDHVWLTRKLTSNHHYLAMSLAPDIVQKITDLRIESHPDPMALDKSFGSRVENLYGGHIWTAHEAGFRSGVVDLKHQLAISAPPLIQDNTDGTDGQQDQKSKDEDHWGALALLLGLTRDELIQQYNSLQIGISYNTQEDKNVCASCEAVAGDYFAPQQCPAPGEVCQGFAACRCYLGLVVKTP